MDTQEKGNHSPIEGYQGSILRVGREEVICTVAGVTLFGSADNVRAARSALEAGPLPTYPDELTTELREVLGWMCFQCISIAQLMREAGIDVKKRAEDEQAHVLHWMVKLVLRHGADWRKAGTRDLEMWRERANELSDKSEGAPA
ncbi:hypothetical protein [Paraburkholderia heleia]|uniref:hypothetical protein n=1 Tax=Paraburkholderia heleia TaxID=634127 RepID=UPI002AB73DAA|nr:hypothetical protein [Paraburkholderia heleia]